jgi:putative Ca2+/H+ antiporter (TMEM165/GDT1 family)
VNLAVAATTLALVIPAELPDKTFISCVVLSSRYRPLYVWAGAAAGLVTQAAIAVVAGGLLDLLPHRAVQSVVAALFLGGAAYLIFVPEKAAERKGGELAEREGEADKPPSASRVMLTTFGIIVLAEFGDITQVLIANLAARYRDPVSVFLGASLAFCLVAMAGVLGGRILTRYVPLALVRRLSGVALLGFGVYTIVSLVRG